MSNPFYLGGVLVTQDPKPRPPSKFLPFKPNGKPCCEKAVRAQCVCIARYVCPVHGDNCWGNHD